MRPLSRRRPYASWDRVVEARGEEGQVRSGTQQQKRQQIGMILPALLLGELTSEWQALLSLARKSNGTGC